MFVPIICFGARYKAIGKNKVPTSKTDGIKAGQSGMNLMENFISGIEVLYCTQILFSLLNC